MIQQDLRGGPGLPGGARAAELSGPAGGGADLVGAVPTVVLVVAQPLGGDAAAPRAAELPLLTQGGGAGRAPAAPHAVLTGATHARAHTQTNTHHIHTRTHNFAVTAVTP